MCQSVIRFSVCQFKTFSLFACLLLSMGCVKENREECPCRLLVDLSDVDSTMIDIVNVALTDNAGFVYNGSRSVSVSDDVILVPRGEVFMTVSYADGGMMTASGLNIPEGSDCPPIYMCSSLVLTSGHEFVRKYVRMMKNHCVMTIYLEGDKTDFPFDIVVKGNVCGYDSVGLPMTGKFSCMPVTQSDDKFVVILPRQVDASLVMEVNDGTETLKNFALGEYVKACGYDWSEDDLKDISVRIDYARTKVVIAVKGWSEVCEFDIVI